MQLHQRPVEAAVLQQELEVVMPCCTSEVQSTPNLKQAAVQSLPLVKCSLRKWWQEVHIPLLQRPCPHMVALVLSMKNCFSLRERAIPMPCPTHGPIGLRLLHLGDLLGDFHLFHMVSSTSHTVLVVAEVTL